MQKAVFVTKLSAALAIAERAKSLGMSNVDIAKHGRIYPHRVRGEMRGYCAFYPVQDGNNIVRNPIMEN